MSPFDILNVAETCDDETVRQAYLSAVKQFPPGQSPVLFSRIAAAYQQISTQEKRMRYLVAGKADLAEGGLVDQALAFGLVKRQRPQWLLLQSSLKEHQRTQQRNRTS